MLLLAIRARQMSLMVIGLLLCSASFAFTGNIALTFDDAPTADSPLFSGESRTTKIIATLIAQKVPDALFFVKADTLPPATINRIKRYTDAGLHIANHSFSHVSANNVPADEFLVDAYRAHLLLKGLDNFLPYFRPPYLHYGKDMEAIAYIQKNLAALNYKDGFVTIDNADWAINALLVKAASEGKKIDLKKARRLYVQVLIQAIEFFDALAQKTYGHSPNHVLLLHENDTTALFLGDLIAQIRKSGGHIISPQEAYADPAYQQFPMSYFQKQGRVAAAAQLQGVPIEQLKHPAEDSQYLEALFNQHAVFK
ncbi:MAG TPA: polysaccharide deacetylase family protein [Cellvibrionaceae bacterium]|nr:polysaccharide deacetylase family protein [Cellvibrionaceae bacterium]